MKNDGTVVAWGNNNYGQTTVPATVQGTVVAVAGGFGYSAALKNDGSVVVWGYYYDGETNVPMTAQSGVVGIAGSHTASAH